MNSNAEDTDYYQILGISPKSSIDEVKKAFKKKAMEMHPDKGGDPEEVLFYLFMIVCQTEKRL